MNAKNKNNETTSISEAFQQLIPANAVSNVNKSMIAGEFLRLRYETAMSIKTDNPALAAEELARFKDNCRLANAISLGIELRNYLLWEIYSTEQYRQTDQDFVAFGMRMTELKKAQLMRSVHAGRIRIEMIQADLDDVRPTCRQVEALSKIEKKHTVNAWLHALAHVKVHGRSDAKVIEGLIDYCKIKKIPFGKRMPNGSGKLPFQKVLRKSPEPEKQKVNGDDWNLNLHEQELILGIDPETSSSMPDPELRRTVSKHVEAIKNLAAKNELSDYETRQTEELLAMVCRKDEEMGRSLVKLALHSVRELMLKEIKKSDGNTKPKES